MPFVAALALAAPIVVRDLHDPRALDPIHAEPRATSAAVLEDHPRHRPARIDVLSYDLDVAVEPVAGTVEGAVTVRFKATEPQLPAVVLDALDMQILGVTAANGRSLETRYDGELLTIVLDGSLALGDEASVRVAYKAPMPQGMLVTGPDATNPQRMRAAYTYTQPEEGRTWFPSMDRPSDKAALTISVRVPEGYNALSNGTPVATTGRGTGRGAERNVFSYRLDQPIATYLVSLAVGSYDVVPMGDFKGKTLTLWAPPHIRAQAVAETARTQRMMEVFSAFTGVDYPYDSYAQSVAQAYRGSMEHTTATTMGGGRITGDGSGESVVAHELAHQWFGDWVTCRTWGELWLNEGFASYLPYVFFAAEGEDARALGQLDHFRYGYFGQARTTVHPLSSPEPDMANIFDSHAYEKGALVLHHLRTLAERFGTGTFTNALRTYLQEKGGDRDGGTVTSQDLQAALEKVTGQSWQDVFDQWVRSAGHPVLAASIEQKDGEAYLVVEQKQATRADRRWRAFTFPLTIEMIDAKGGVSYADVDVYDDVQRIKLPISRAGLVAVNLDPRWTLPAEITLTQGAAAWREILARSTEKASRLVALRALLVSGEGSLSAEELALVRRDASVYVKTDALAGLSAKAENRDAVLALYRDLSGVRDHDVSTRGAIARAEEWLVKTLGRIPTREQEQEWRERFVSTQTQAERTALLGMLEHASRDRAQAFALARLEEAHWVTMDRRALVDVLTKNPTPTSAPFVEALVRDGSYLYQKQGLANLTAKGYDAPALVPSLVAGATESRYLDVRVAMIDLLAKQTSSRIAACETLVELARVGLGGVRPEALADVRASALRAIAAHDGCVR